MSNVPSAKKYVQTQSVQTRRPVSESLEQTIGASVNYCLDKSDFYANKTIKTVEFFSSGTWTPPADLVGTTVSVYSMGGGGGGGGSTFTVGGQGGSGCVMVCATFPIASLTPIVITIGTGGAGSFGTGGTGTGTFFGATLVCNGAPGGFANTIANKPSGNWFTGGSGSGGNNGQDSENHFGGTGTGGGGHGGGGGASSLADGGNGGFGGGGGSGFGPGAGGGGAGATGGASPGGTAGDGYLKIVYISGY